MSGLFLAFEGGEGAGKSTQARLLCDALRAAGCHPILLREPGSTPLGDYLRDWLIDGPPLSPAAELLLFEASRAELTATVIIPQLAAGAVVIADRFTGSTVAYQGYGRGLDRQEIAWLNRFAAAGRRPDLTILLDLDPETGLTRAARRQPTLDLPLPAPDTASLPAPDTAPTASNAAPPAPDRFEDAALAFHHAVRRGFRQQAADCPHRWQIIDARPPVADVAAAVWDAVAPLLARATLRRPAR